MWVKLCFSTHLSIYCFRCFADTILRVTVITQSDQTLHYLKINVILCFEGTCNYIDTCNLKAVIAAALEKRTFRDHSGEMLPPSGHVLYCACIRRLIPDNKSKLQTSRNFIYFFFFIA